MSWTQDRKDRLKSLWLEGKTSGQIADALGDITRNAVMGMVNRMGLMGNQGHNALIRPVHGACKPLRLKVAEPTNDVVCDVQPEQVREVQAVTTEPASSSMGEASQAPASAQIPVTESSTVAEAVSRMHEERLKPLDPLPPEIDTHSVDVVSDEPAPVEKQQSGSGLARRLLNPLKRMVAERPTSRPVQSRPVERRSPPAIDISKETPRRLDLKTAVSLVEEITGMRYSATSTGHRTALVSIAAILGGGDPRRILPRDFPEPVIVRTMRSLAENGTMIAGKIPETWLDPDLGDLNFFIDMLRVDGVLSSPKRTASRSLSA